MTGIAILLVLLSAVAHASWNYLTKRASQPAVFTWWMAVTSNLITAPLAVALFVVYTPGPVGWLFIGATWVLHVAYFFTLSRAYTLTDLSLAYPIARGLGLMLIPMLGVFWLNETMSPPAALGVAAILVGIFTLTWWGRVREFLGQPGRLLRDVGVRYAVATGAIIGVYSAVDKQGVQHVTPLLYMFFIVSSGTIGMLPVVWRRHGTEAFSAEWRAHRPSIVVGGLLQFAAYGLVLTALEVSRVSYVGPFRELGIVFGVLLGTVILREPFPRGRVLGAMLIAMGATAIALAP